MYCNQATTIDRQLGGISEKSTWLDTHNLVGCDGDGDLVVVCLGGSQQFLAIHVDLHVLEEVNGLNGKSGVKRCFDMVEVAA